MAKPPMHEIRLVDHGFLQGRRAELKSAIDEAFKGSHFTSNKSGPYGIFNASVDYDPAEVPHTRHLLAFDGSGAVVGAAFHIPSVKRADVNADGMGWFFTSPKLTQGERRELADRLVEAAQRHMREAGIRTVYTTIGTREGALFLQRRHGYKKAGEPPFGKDQIWQKAL